MPVPKTLAAKTEAPAAPVEPETPTEELAGDLRGDSVTDAERFHYERRREALGFAVQVRAGDPVDMARDMLAFLEGDKRPEVTA